MTASLHDVGKQRHETRALDGFGENALLAGRDSRDARRHDLAALGHEALQQLHVLVVDLGRVGAGERAGLLATEEGTALAATTGMTHCSVSCTTTASPSGLRSPPSRSRRALFELDCSNWSTFTVM